MSEPPVIKPGRRISRISRILMDSGLRPDRRFGQSFLINQGALEAIVGASKAGPRSCVIEIGAGLGNLTDLLSKRAGAVTSVELDLNFREIHQRHFAGAGNVRFVYGDFLEQALGDLTPEGDWDERLVVGNIPFNITSRILIKLLEERGRFDRAYILMQREVAERLRAPAGTRTYSVLTAKLRCGFDMAIKLRITGRSFLPPVRVESALVELTPCAKPIEMDTDERSEFFAMLDGAFGQRRKTLPNSIANMSSNGWPREDVARTLDSMGLDPRIRAEQLDSRQFFDLYKRLRQALGPATFLNRRR